MRCCGPFEKKIKKVPSGVGSLSLFDTKCWINLFLFTIFSANLILAMIVPEVVLHLASHSHSIRTKIDQTSSPIDIDICNCILNNLLFFNRLSKNDKQFKKWKLILGLEQQFFIWHRYRFFLLFVSTPNSHLFLVPFLCESVCNLSPFR